MPTAADRGRAVRARLLSAAVELIAERGWTAVSTRMVAERAGVGSGLVHYHFSSVHALLSEAAVDRMRQLVEEIDPVLRSAGTAAEGVDLLMAALVDYTGDDPASVLFVETYLAATRDPELRDAVARVLDRFRARLASWLDECGVADPGATAAVLGSAIDGLVLHRALGSAPVGEAATHVLGRLLSAQRTPGGDR